MRIIAKAPTQAHALIQRSALLCYTDNTLAKHTDKTRQCQLELVSKVRMKHPITTPTSKHVQPLGVIPGITLHFSNF